MTAGTTPITRTVGQVVKQTPDHWIASFTTQQDMIQHGLGEMCAAMRARPNLDPLACSFVFILPERRNDDPMMQGGYIGFSTKAGT